MTLPVLLLAAALVPGPAPSGELSLADALARMRATHEGLRAADLEVAQRAAEAGAAAGLRWPRLEASGRFTRMDDPIVIDLDPIRQVILKLHPSVPAAAVPPFTLDVQERSFWKADLRATWPLFAGGRIDAAGHAAGAQLEDARAGRRQAEDGLVTELVRRYFAVRLAARARDVRAEVLEGLSRHVKDAGRLEEEGLIARADRLHADVARAEADRQLQRATNDLALARAALANILSVDAPGESALEPATPLFVAQPPPLAEMQRRALAHAPALARVAAQERLAGAALAGEKGRLFPEIALFGVRELVKHDLTVLDPTWAAGLSARLTLFDGLARERSIAAARHRAERVAEIGRRARRDVETLVEKRWREADKARAQLDALGPARTLAEESLRVRTRAFEEGMATSLDVVDARLSLSKVRLERLLAAYELDVALAELLEACGESDGFESLRAAAPSAEEVER